MSHAAIIGTPVSCAACKVTPEDPAMQLENMGRWAGDYWLCVDISGCIERMLAIPQSPSAAATSPAAEGEEPGPAIADGTPDGPVAGPGSAQASAPGAPLDGTEPATPAGGEPSAEALGAEHQPDEVTQEEVEAEFGPARTESEAAHDA